MKNPVYEPSGKAREYSEMALNIYTGCDHGCAYCYAPSVLKKDRTIYHSDVKLREGVLEALERQCASGSLNGKTVLLCFTCDPYSPAAVKTGATRKALEIFNKYGINFNVLTKGGMRAAEDFDLYKPGDSFGTTMTFAYADTSMGWEPMAAFPKDRAHAIQVACDKGIKTWVSLEPVISTTDALVIVESLFSCVGKWKVGKWNYDARAKDIDWKVFGNEIEQLFIRLGCDYYIKEDLRKAMA